MTANPQALKKITNIYLQQKKQQTAQYKYTKIKIDVAWVNILIGPGIQHLLNDNQH